MSRKKIAVYVRTILAVLLATIFCFSTLTFAEETEDPSANIANWHTYTMTPGETYDISHCKSNTTVEIVKAGSYWLEGKSSHIRVAITSGDVKLYLKDGLKITPGAEANVGSRTAAIDVGEQGGTVEIISCEDATIKLEGYLNAPAIQKNANITKLIFSTEDPDNPGKITATAKGLLNYCPGIGNAFSGSHKTDPVGNIYFESGIIEAYGGNNGGAGIGGAVDKAHVGPIVINGGDITAEGAKCAAGIGAGTNGNFGNITINGGTVVAIGGSGGAGIGGSAGSSEFHQVRQGKKITINGGNILATGKSGAAGIGCGTDSTVQDIVINGGDITAVSKGAANNIGGCGIGGPGGKGMGCGAVNITITGGTIHASGEEKNSSGIGTGYSSKQASKIRITDGIITAVGGTDGFGIGGTTEKAGSLKLTIEGGTIKAEGSEIDIGSTFESGMTTVITGGNVKVNNISPVAVNEAGTEVYSSKIYLKEVATGTAAKITQITYKGEAYSYSSEGAVTLDGDKNGSYFYAMVPFYPTVISAAEAGDKKLYGYISSDIDSGGTLIGTLWEGTRVTLNPPAGSAVAYGSGLYGYLQTIPTRFNAVAAPEGYCVKGYFVGESGTPDNIKVLEASGTPAANVIGTTDSKGRWIETEEKITLHAVFEPETYTVNFDANVPEDASTTLSGKMDSKTVEYKEALTLQKNAFALPGYYFYGWNTAADGTGTPYDDGATITFNTALNNMQMTLYAVWKPLTYRITFAAGEGGTGTTNPEDMTFDKTKALTANGFLKSGSFFAGWTKTASLGSRVYADMESVENLVTGDVLSTAWLTAYNDAKTEAGGTEPTVAQIMAKYNDSIPTVSLTAQWEAEAAFVARVTLDNAPVQSSQISLKPESGEAIELPETTGSNGILSHSASLTAGTYEVLLNGVSTGKTWTVGAAGQGMLMLQYYSVNVVSDEQIDDIEITAPSSPFTGNGTNVPVGAEISIHAKSINRGYTFDSWESPGTDPSYTGGTDNRDAKIKLQITGTTKMKANARPVQYSVKFDKNGGDGTEMETALGIYGIPTVLPSNTYTRDGYLFTGWNTATDGKGTSYDDGASGNFADTEGAVVTLYAQWKPIRYTLKFDLNGADGKMKEMICVYDISDTIPSCKITYEGYTFRNWNTKLGGNGDSLKPGEEFKNLTTSSDGVVTLYAQWDFNGAEEPAPATGDKGYLLIWAALALFCVLAIAGAIVKRREN